MMNKLKIVHYGDIQIELRVSGEGSQRYDEFKAVLSKTEKLIEEQKPDIVVIPGDIYQYAITEGEEQEMFSEHLHSILPNTQRIILIAGNHDIKQRNNGLIKNGEKENTGDSIRSVVNAIKSDKISYYRHTGFYPDSKFDIVWAVWSQVDKHSTKDPKPAYSPWFYFNEELEEKFKDKAIIELYHDPYSGAKDFTGNPSEHFKNYGIRLEDFRSNTIISADIHSPEIIWFGENNHRLFTYCSSLVQRNFGEGNYYTDERLTTNGNDQHGLNILEYSIEERRALNCEFIKIDNPVSRHTIYLTANFDYSDLSIQLIANSIKKTAVNKIRIICQANRSQFIDNEQRFLDTFNKSFDDCVYEISFGYSKDIMNVELSEEQFDSFEEFLDKEKILQISKSYISSLVDKTSMLDKDEKDEAKEYIYELFEEEFLKKELTSDITNYSFLSAKIDNFMNFDKVELKFKNNQLTRILGSNGLGKTKIYSFLQWMLNDRIDALQDVRNKKYNYALYFNDSSEKDSVFGELEMFINEKHVKIEKTLTRSWKKNEKDIYKPDWIESLKGAPTVQLIVTITENGAETIKKDDEAFEFLNLHFNFAETHKLLFVDAYVLKNLIKTPSEELSNELLSTMGINITDDLLSTYDQVKSEKLADLPKPQEKKEEIQAKIESKIIEKTESQNNIDSQKQIVQKYLDDKVLCESSIQKLNDEKHKVEELFILEDKILSNSNLIQAKKSNAEDSKNTIQRLELKISEEFSENIDTEITEIRKKIDLKNEEITKITSQKHSEELQKADYSNVILSRINTIKEEFSSQRLANSEKLMNSQSKLSELKKSKDSIINEYYSKIDSIKTDFSSKIDDENIITTEVKSLISNEEKIKMSNQFNIDSLNKEIDSNKTNIEVLENSKTCNSCGAELKGENLEKILNKAKELTAKNAELTKEVQKLEEDIKVSDSTLKELSTKLENSQTKISEFKKKSDQLYELKIFDYIQENEFFDVTDLNSRTKSVDTEIENLQLEISELQKKSSEEYWNSIIKERLSEDAETLATKNKIQNTDKLIIELNEQIKVLEEEKTAYNSEISAKENRKLEKEQILQSIQKNKEHILLINKEVELLSNQIKETEKHIELAKENEKTDEKIKEFRNSVYELNEKINSEQQKLYKLEFGSTNIDDEIKSLQKDLEDIRKYKIADSSLKLYKQLLSKKGLPQFLFSSLLNLINSKLNDSLEDVNFRLIFDAETLELRFVDLDKNVSRPVLFISGMQETVTGLALIKLKLLLNRSKRFNMLFIDEISGKVTDGKQLSYSSKDYRKILQHFVEDLAKNNNVYIVDHIINYHNERVFEVQPGENGSIVVEL